ncbi:MAG: hypothetical protein PHV59_08640 [Victivallales bacterium]|nr:hypothetical protein [Victivallales bacterium]
MYRTRLVFAVVAGLFLTALLSGCMQFDYVGQKLTPLTPDQTVAFYNSKDSVPPNIYRVLGRAVVTAPDGTNTEDVKAELLEKAREYGADAIEVVMFKRVKTGETVIPHNEPYSGPTGSWVVTSNRPDGTPIYTDTFVDTVPLQTRAVATYEIRAQVLFLADKEKIKKSMEKYQEDRRSYMHGTSRYAR